MIWPDRDLQEAYILHQSVWEAVWARDMTLDAAIEYMQLDSEELKLRVRLALKKKEIPL